MDDLTLRAFPPYSPCQSAGRPLPGMTGFAAQTSVEESPGSRDQRWRLTAAGGDPRESATENKPPAWGRPHVARVKRCGKSAPRFRQRRRHGKPHREQDRIGAARMLRATWVSSAILAAARVGCTRLGAIRAPEEWPSRRTLSRQNPAYRPTGKFVSSRCIPGSRAFARLSGTLPRQDRPCAPCGALRPGTHAGRA